MVSIAGAIALGVFALAAFSYTAVQRELRGSTEERALRDSELLVTQLAPARLPAAATDADLSGSTLIADLNRTAAGFSVRFDDGSEVASGFAFAAEPQEGVRRLVADGRFALQWVTLGDGRTYVLVAARQPPSGPDYYLYYDGEATQDALGTLARWLLAGSGVVVVAGLVAAGLASRRILRPVTRVADAAQRVAGGDLELEVPVESDDEIGELAVTFNQMTESLAAKVAELEQAEADQRGFVADVSHELRTPLTALVHEAHLLSEAMGAGAAADSRLVELLVSDVDRLHRLVEDLLEVSRLDAGSEGVEAQPVDVERFLQAVVDSRYPAATLGPVPAGAWLTVDRRRLERIVANLLDNARVHAEGAEVEVSVTLDRGGSTCCISVADRGPGIAPGSEERIFGRFVKQDPARHHGGSGLGLAIARAHARRLGGDLRARARPGGGVAFDLHLPFTPVTESLPAGEDDETSLRQRRG